MLLEYANAYQRRILPSMCLLLGLLEIF